MLIVCIISAIILIHCIYHFKLDIFNMLKSKPYKESQGQIQRQGQKERQDTNEIVLLNQSINELKTLNECIHNGKIDTAFS